MINNIRSQSYVEQKSLLMPQGGEREGIIVRTISDHFRVPPPEAVMFFIPCLIKMFFKTTRKGGILIIYSYVIDL